MELLINIDVPDLAAAEAFYTAAFALRPARRFGGDAIELLGANVPIYLLHKPAGSTAAGDAKRGYRSEEHTSELQSLMRISYAVFCLKKKKNQQTHIHTKELTSSTS